jgi:hypothetical protein
VRLALPLAAAAALVAGAHCTWKTDLPPGAASIPIARDRELVVTDDATLSSLSSNTDDGPLSFRRALEHLATTGSGGDPTYAWMTAWSQRLRDDGDPARGDALDATVTCPWLLRNTDNQCTPSCDACAARVLRLEDAPFRLVAVVNRTDLSVMPDRAAEGGEGRLVFALTAGAADAPDAVTQPMAVGIEYAQEGAAKDWAQRWHALAADPDAAFPADLAAVASTFVDAGTLAQIRTDDALTGPLALHEFHLTSGALVAATVRDTPDWSKVTQHDVETFCDANGDAIENGTHVLPAGWLAASSTLDAPEPAYLAGVSHHDALLHGTCGGCHGDGTGGFQIDPRAKGDAKLSRFLVDPTKDLDEIGRRTEWMQLTLSQ